MLRCLTLLACTWIPIAAAEPTVVQADDAVRIDLGNGAHLTFPMAGDYLLGLGQAEVEGISLTDPGTITAPFLAQEFGPDPMIWTGLVLREALVVDGAIELRCELRAVTGSQAQRDYFVFAGDVDAAKAAGLPKDLQDRVDQAEIDRAAIDAAVLALPDAVQAQAEIDRLRAEAAAATEAKARKGLEKKLRQADKEFTELRRRLRPQAIAADAGLRARDERCVATAAAVHEHAVTHFGRIHRDYYRFAMTLQPAAMMQSAEWLRRVRRSESVAAGTFTWIIRPETRVIAGWPWKGWSQQYRFALPEGREVNAVRTHGTWELGGRAAGTTAVALRYRGLGRIEQAFTAGAAGGVAEAFTTTEILPGAVGGAPVISPAVPSTSAVGDRGYALLHRAGAWIGRPARGAGAPFVDFQYRPGAALAMFPERQGDLRSLTECFPGDDHLSQTDEEWFPLRTAHTTIPMNYLVQVSQVPQPAEVWRTRWHEVDQDVRNRVSAELDFVQPTALPGIGFLATAGTSGHYQNLVKTGAAERWAAVGVRIVASHSPGWLRGSSSAAAKEAAGVPLDLKTGGECSIFDFVPDTEMADPWKQFTRTCAQAGVAYFPWLGMTVVDHGPMVRRIGRDRPRWSLNTPDDAMGPGYDPVHIKGSIVDEAFRADWEATLQAAVKDFGIQGWWIDSFQNLFMSQLAWGDGSGAPMQRAWWEHLAAWSRQGVATMAESHAFPGLSCSIEVQRWEEDVTFFRHVWKWHRGDTQTRYAPETLDRLCYRAAAVKGWTAPDLSYKTDAEFPIPSFSRIAHEYLAALPGMARPYLLADDAGVLWLPPQDDGTAVLFSFKDQPFPAGVEGSAILDRSVAARAQAQTTYTLRTADPRSAFGIPGPPLPDERLGRDEVVQPFTYQYPSWAK